MNSGMMQMFYTVMPLASAGLALAMLILVTKWPAVPGKGLLAVAFGLSMGASLGWIGFHVMLRSMTGVGRSFEFISMCLGLLSLAAQFVMLMAILSLKGWLVALFSAATQPGVTYYAPPSGPPGATPPPPNA